MEVNIFGFRLELSRANCPFCMATDAFDIVSIILGFYYAYYIPVAAVATGAALFGISDEIIYQAKTLNFYSTAKILSLRSIQAIIAFVFGYIFLFSGGISSLIFFSVSSLSAFLINLYRYKDIGSLKGDFIFFAVFILEILIAY